MASCRSSRRTKTAPFDEPDVTTPDQPAELQKARRRMIAGAMLVMGACVFGGLTAIVLMALGQRTVSAAVAVITGLVIIAGVVVQVAAVRKMKQQASPK
jgi:hypothetical protein